MVRRIVLFGLSIFSALTLVSCPSKYTLGFPGTLPVAYYDTEFGPQMPATIFYPDTNPRQTNLPVVIFDCGWNQPRGTYFGYGTQLAQWGFVCVIRFYPSPGLVGIGDDFVPLQVDQSVLLVDWLFDENLRPESPLFGMVDAETIGTTGHSLGATVAILHAAKDNRVKAMVSLDAGYADESVDPEELIGPSIAAHLYLISEDGGWCAQAPGTEIPLFDITDAPTAEAIIVDADHLDFEDTMIGLNYLGQVFCPSSPGGQTPQAVRTLATRYMIAWFNVYLKGETDFARYYAGAEAQEDIDAGLVKIRLNLE
jgi:hypothetical protein